MQRRYWFILILLATSLTLCGFGETFRNPVRIPVSSDPAGIMVGDINGDGLMDIVWQDIVLSPYVLHTLLANHAGGYLPGPDLVLPPNAGGCRLFDSNKDGKLDLVCTSSSASNTSLLIFLGHGDATFAAPRTIPLPYLGGNSLYPRLSPPFDFNGDGIPDLVVSDDLNRRSYVLLGDTLAGYRVGATLPTSEFPVAALDVNGDGKPDLLYASGPSVALGNGDGTFGSLQGNLPPFNYTSTCAFHDMDRDGHVDAVCGSRAVVNGAEVWGQTHLIVLHGNPDGSFNPNPISDKTFGDKDYLYDGFGNFQSPLLVADLNGDGIPDILAYANDGFTVLFGGPGLSFSNPVHYAVGTIGRLAGTTTNWADQIVDINGDGLLDVVASGANSIFISGGRSDGTFDTALISEVAEFVSGATVADFNGDGIPDLVASGDTTLRLNLSKGDGTFLPFTLIPNGGVDFGAPLSATNAHIAHGDFNGDGKQDLLATGSSGTYQYVPYILFGHGDGTFDAPRLVPQSTTHPQYSGLNDDSVLDINGDGLSDLVGKEDGGLPGTSNSINVALSNGDGTFRLVSTPVPTEALSPGPGTYNYSGTPPAFADFNGDRKLDAVVGSFNNAYVLRGHGDGSFDSTGTVLPIPQGTTNGSIAVATGDFDGDGNQDVAVLAIPAWYNFGSPPLTSRVFIYYGAGDGTFSPPTVAVTSNRAYGSVHVADLNKDGLSDLILDDGGNYAAPKTFFGIVHALPGRSFGPEVNYTVGVGFSSLDVADMNGDGFPDLIVGNGDYNLANGAATVLLNLGNIPVVTGTVYAAPEPSVIGQPFLLSASLLPPVAAALSGTVDFTIDGTSVGSASLAGNVASLSIPGGLPIGTHTLAAVWAGNATYPSLILTGRHIVIGLPSTTTITSSQNPSLAGTPVTFSASVAPGSGSALPTGSVTFSDGSALLGSMPLGPGNVASLTTSSLSIGKHTIVALYTGDSLFASSTASLVQEVDGIAVASSLAAAPNPAFVGQTVLLSAQASNTQPAAAGVPGGTFTYTDGSAVLGQAPLNATGTATLSVTFSSVGAHPLLATYSGDATHLSGSATMLETVLAGPTATTLTSSANPIATGTLLTLTATVAPAYSSTILPTGQVAFRDAGTVLATVPLNAGSATYSTATLVPGTHPLSAVFSGSPQFNSSTSPILQQVVTHAASATLLSATPNPAYQGNEVLFSAAVGAPPGIVATGTVQFLDGGSPVALIALTGGAALLRTSQLAPGHHLITAIYSGDGNLFGSTSAPLDETILLANFTLASDPPTLSLRTGHHATLILTVTSSGGFADDVTLSLAPLPAHASSSFPKGATLHIIAGASPSTPLYVDTDDVVGYLSRSEPPASTRGFGNQPRSASLPFAIFPASLLTVLGLLRRRKGASLVRAALCLLLLGTLAGCSGLLPASTAPGSYTLHLSASGSSTGLTRTLDIPLLVTE